MRVVGIDPAKKPCIIANKNGIETFNKFFNKETASQIEKKFGKFDFITSHNVLAHTENIQEIFLSIYKLLKENAYFCFEIGYFKDVIKNNIFD
jgi:2-polyprenyl-3-methyl-5-hydroxy-6-metoxy-1,4-benzoquinol methylase